MTDQTSDSPERPGSAIEKAFRLIDTLVDEDRALALRDVVERTGMPKGSAHRMLTQLEAAGIVKRDVTGKRFSPGEAMSSLAVRMMARAGRAPDLRHAIAALVARTGETCNLGVRDGDRVMYVERVESPQPLRAHLRAGSRVPMHATAVGKLLLAAMPDQLLSGFLNTLDLAPLTASTAGRDKLVRQIAEIRRTDVSISHGESMAGLAGIGVPIRDGSDMVVAGLGLEMPSARFDEVKLDQVVRALRETADEIALMINGRV